MHAHKSPKRQKVTKNDILSLVFSLEYILTITYQITKIYNIKNIIK